MAKTIKPHRTIKGGIRIQFHLRKKRYSVTPVPDGEWGNESDMAIAKAVAEQIARDITVGEFDASLIKYRPKIFAGRSPHRTGDFGEGELDILELWKLYCDHRKPMVSPSTFNSQYRRVSQALVKLFEKEITDPADIIHWLQTYRTPDSVRRHLVQLNACCKWGLDRDLIQKNPFSKPLKNFAVPKNKDKDDINPFTEEERDKIISMFRCEHSLQPYAYLVDFIFNIGCRPSEALALTWKDVQHGVIHFNKTFNQFGLKEGLKTQSKRVVRQNEKIKELLKEISHSQRNDKTGKLNLIFPSPKSRRHIDWNNFSNKPWKRVFNVLPDIFPRNPYQMRHTFITLALKNGVPIQDLAKHCGNSPEIILKHYAGVDRAFVMPTF
jgi:integrase